jgi:hypothetical protein
MHLPFPGKVRKERGAGSKKIIKNDGYNNFIAIFAFEIVNTFNRNAGSANRNESVVSVRRRPYGRPLRSESDRQHYQTIKQQFKNCAYDRINRMNLSMMTSFIQSIIASSDKIWRG